MASIFQMSLFYSSFDIRKNYFVPVRGPQAIWCLSFVNFTPDRVTLPAYPTEIFARYRNSTETIQFCRSALLAIGEWGRGGPLEDKSRHGGTEWQTNRRLLGPAALDRR